MQRAFWIQYTSLKVIMDKSFFFFILCLTTQIFPVRRVQCEDEHCPLQPVDSSSGCSWHWAQLAFSLHNNPPEHLNMALSVPPSGSFLCNAFKCFLQQIWTVANSRKCLDLRKERLLLKSQSWDLSGDKTCEQRKWDVLVQLWRSWVVHVFRFFF